MPDTLITYSLSSDFGGSLNAVTIKKDIDNSSIASATYLHVNTSGDVVDLVFNEALSGPDTTTLNSIVSSHDNTPHGSATAYSGSTSLPTADDDESTGAYVGYRWVYSPTDEVYICTDTTVGAAVWKKITENVGNLDCENNSILNIRTAVFNSEYDFGSLTVNATMDLSLSSFFTLTVDEDITIGFSNPSIGRIQIRTTQGSQGSKNITWPGNVKWSGGSSPTISTAIGEEDVVTLFYNGTDFYGTIVKGFA